MRKDFNPERRLFRKLYIIRIGIFVMKVLIEPLHLWKVAKILT